MRVRTILLPLGAALGVTACAGSGRPAALRPAPPTPIDVSVYIGARQVRVSPAHFGAGPVLLTATNQGAHAVRLQIRDGTRTVARSALITPQGSAQEKVELARGDYALIATPAGRRSEAQRTLPARATGVRLRVGRPRASGGSRLLQP